MINLDDLYVMDIDVLHEHLYRMGNSGSPGFSEERGLRDCLVVDRKGVQIVVANGNGFSAFNHITPLMKRKGKNIWKLKKGADIPPELRVVKWLGSPPRLVNQTKALGHRPRMDEENRCK